MNQPIKTVTIGIPTYNESNNISLLLADITKQVGEGFEIQEIIIADDASQDETRSLAATMGDERVKIISNSERAGIGRGLNQILENSHSDILITLDADIRINDPKSLAYLINPILHEFAEFTSSSIFPFKPKTATGRALAISLIIKKNLFNLIGDGNNIYTCYGLARAYSKKFYSQLRFPVSIGNDMYSYLLCRKLGFTFLFVHESQVYFKLPETISDHRKQSSRFNISAKELGAYFDSDIIAQEINIPLFIFLYTATSSIPIVVLHPLSFMIYMYIFLYCRLTAGGSSQNQAWDIAKSSK